MIFVFFWLTSLSMIIFSCIHVATNGIISFFFVAEWYPLCICIHAQLLRHVWLFVTPWAVAYQAPPSMEFSRQDPRVSSWPRDQTQVSHIAGRHFTLCTAREVTWPKASAFYPTMIHGSNPHLPGFVITFYWHTAISVQLHIIYGCFCAIMKKLTSCYRD